MQSPQRVLPLLLVVILALILASCSDGSNTTGTTTTTPSGSDEAALLDQPADSARDGQAPDEQDEKEKDDKNEKVTICHRTNSDDNPFVLIKVSESAVKGHTQHEGDVIAPFDGFPGHNWPSDIVDSRCQSIVESPSTTAPGE